MTLMKELFTTPEGLFSFVVIFLIFVIGGYIFHMVKKKINEQPPTN